MREVAVITTGFFDGVHLGHRHVLETVVSSARERGEEAVVVTFWPHPRTVLQQDARDFRLLSSMEEKKELLHACGIDRVEVLPVDRSFAAMTAAEYLALLRDRFGATLVVMGYDNRIGSDCLTAADLSGAGTEVPVLVSKPLVLGGSDTPVSVSESSGPTAEGIYFSQGFAKNQIPSAIANPTRNSAAHPCCHSERSEESLVISSTQIRKALEEGRVEDANAMLGYEYGLYGVVVSGNQMGRTIGFPTANMQLYEPLKLVPQNGVYAVEVEVMGRTYRGMCNIGLRPTVGGTTRTIETHILDFDQDIYGLPLQLRFLRRIRDERRFPSLDALRSQLLEDRIACAR